MYFAEGVSSLFATHPPLHDRIRRLDPQWDGKYPPAMPADPALAFEESGAAALAERPPGETAVAQPNAVPLQVMRHAAEQVADPTESHRRYVQRLVAAMPPTLVDAAHEPYGARAVVFAMLLDRDADIRAAQLRALQQAADPHVFEQTLRLVPAVNQLDARARLPLVDMTLPALRALSLSQYQEFAQCFTQLVEADRRLGLFEWALHQVLLRHLRPQFQPIKPTAVRYYGLQRLGEPISVLLSALARASQQDDPIAFAAGARQLPEVALRLRPLDASSLETLQASLQELAHTPPKLRQRLVDACAACICADAAVQVREAELLRAICDMLDCPMPPLLPGLAVKPVDRPSREASRV